MIAAYFINDTLDWCLLAIYVIGGLVMLFFAAREN